MDAPPVSADALHAAIESAQRWLMARQQPDGHWVGELEGDTILETEYVLLLQFLGLDDQTRMRELCRYAIGQWQQEDGGVPIYRGGPSDISASVKAYFACKLAGHAANEPFMIRLRECILRMGGVTRCNTFTKLYLAVFGQYDWEGVPTIPPEIMLAPHWLYLNVYAMSSWSRAILIPLALINAARPSRSVPPGRGIDELFPEGRQARSLRLQRDPKILTWRNAFLFLDRLLKIYDALPVKPFRRCALRRAEAWLLEHQKGSDGLGAIFPAMTHAVMAYKCLGYADTHPAVQHELSELQRFEIADERGIRLQPCVSPLWDTAIAENALMDSGIPPDDARIRLAMDWILDHEIRVPGDWAVTVRGVEPGGWAFEYRNDWYPDIDDTAMVLMALARLKNGSDGDQRRAEATRRAVNWILAMQSRDGGWASFDKDNTRMLLQYVPYADHNAMLDPPTVDITARVVEALVDIGTDPTHPAIRRGVAFVLRHQESDGSWFGRWGVNYVYGTWQAIRGLRAAGIPADDAAIRRAVGWLVSVQNADGGWGETCESYADPTRKGLGPSTASQTAWAVMALVSAGEANSEACCRGARFLLDTQTEDGTWEEPWFTGTGFPCVFYLRYHLYRHYFPLWALGLLRRAQKG
jgi:squalene-hopene/tetraprenyl-beta-curcumene cyclase